MKKNNLNLFILCTILVAAIAVQTSTAHAAQCPRGGVVDSYQMEITPNLECLEIDMATGCEYVRLVVDNRCDSPVKLEQITPECNSPAQDQSLCSGSILAAEDNAAGADFSRAYSVPAEGEHTTLLKAMYNGESYDVKITYSARIVEYEDGGCSVSGAAKSSPSTPLSILAAFVVVTVMGRRQRQ